MASDNEACCESDPNFAVICGFLKKFGVTCGLANIDFLDLQDMLENNQEVPQQLVDLHVKLLRKARKSVSSERWERAIIKLCYGFCIQDAWEIERFGYKKARLSSKLRILKELLEMQFDYNSKFKNEINKLSAEELRTQPLGRDQLGCVYWFQSDNSCQIRVYKDDPDEETWALVAKDREGLVNLISQLSEGKETVLNEDSNSLESEKPIVDTGQTDTNSTKTESMATTDTNAESAEESNNQDEDPPLLTKEEAVETPAPVTLKLKITKEKPIEEEVKPECSPEKEEPDRFASAPTTPPKADISKKLEYTGVKEKYIRSDSTSSSVHHRKAVDSAGFDVHTNDLKRPIEEEEDVEEPTYVKHPRLDRPTLLSNKKKKPYSEDEEEEDDYDEEEQDEEVSEEIVEPLMLVKGQGSGQDNKEGRCEDASPIIGETIEEPILYFHGEGLGRECETGNDNKGEDVQQESVQNEVVDADLKVINEASNSKTVDGIKDLAECSENLSPEIDCKLGGTGEDIHANKLNSCIASLMKKSRCDMEESEAVDESQRNDVEASGDVELEMENVSKSIQEEEAALSTPKKSVFFFGPGCLQVKPSISPLKNSPTEVSFNSNVKLKGFSDTTTPPKEEATVERCKTVTNRRKSDNPVKKVHEENLGLSRNEPVSLKSSGNTEEGRFKVSDSDSKRIEGMNRDLDLLSNNTLPANHHVPKNSISIFDKKVEGVSDSCNSKKCDVPVTSKLNSSNLGEKRKCQGKEALQVVGLPNIKTDKPKSKLENILEKINQVKSIQKTDSVELGIKYKDNLQPDSIKTVDNATGSNVSSETKTLTAPKLVKEKTDIPLPLKKHLTKKSTINLQNTQLNVQSNPVLSSQILCNSTSNTDKNETGFFISSIIKDSTEETKELVINKSDLRYSNNSLNNANKTSVDSIPSVAEIIENPAVSDVNEKIDTSRTSPADKQIEEEDRQANRPSPPPVQDKPVTTDLNDSPSTICVAEDLTVKKPPGDSTKEPSEIVETANNSKIEPKNEKVAKTPSNDGANADFNESIQSRIFSSIDKSLNDAKCLIPQELPTKKSVKNKVKRQESENSTDAVGSRAFSSKPDKYRAKKLSKGDISLTDILSTSMKVPETILPASRKTDETSAKADLNDNDEKNVPESAESPKKESDLEEDQPPPKTIKSGKNKLTNAKPDPQSKPQDNADQSQNVTTKRVTRRTRSNADKLLEIDPPIPKKTVNCSNRPENSIYQMNNPQVCIKRIDIQLKTPKKLEEKTDNVIETRKSGRIEQQESKAKGKAAAQVNEENKNSKSKTVGVKTFDADLELMATNRELRERKTTIDKNIKPKPRAKVLQKPANTNKRGGKTKQKNNNNGNKTPKLIAKEEQKKAKDKPPAEAIVLEDIEEQIIKNEIKVTRKVVELITVDAKEETATKKDVEETTADVDKTEQNKADEELKPVVEPECIKKHVPLLTDTDTAHTSPPPPDDKPQEQENIVISDSENSCTSMGNDKNVDVVVVPEKDPLALSGEEVKTSEPFMTLATFALDVDDYDDDAAVPVQPMRVTRKRAAQQSIDTLREPRASEKQTKRPKLKKKRSVDRNLRRSVEEKKAKEISSSEDADNDGDVSSAKDIDKRRPSARSARSDSPIPSSDASRTDTSTTPPTVNKQKKPRQIRKTLLGLEISPETESLIKGEIAVGVRQSRRIAQQKIKEEAERRKMEEVALQELKDEQRKRKGKKDEDKDYKLDKRKRNKNILTEDETTGDAESDDKKKRKRKRKHRDSAKQFDVHNPWKSSSGSSSSEMDDEEEDDEEIEEDDDHHMVYKSDHEFSPESDMEEGGEVQPLKRARTARKESDAEEEVDDCACQKCGQKDHPEWILLCDSCDCGWHCSCLRPPLLVIPEGDWFCPPCQHNTLVKNLQAELIEYDKKLNKKEMENRRKERLAYVGISLNNVLPSKDPDDYRHSKHRHHHSDIDNANREESEESDSDESESDSESSSSSEDSEPIYQLRERRQAHSYRFNDYDELINSAIQEDMDAVKGAGNQGRGKDISTIVNAEKEEETESQLQETSEVPLVEPALVPQDLSMAAMNMVVPAEPLPPVVPPDYDKKPENESDDEPIRPVRKIIGKKKHRKLNSLDVSSGDDAESDEDFKGSSTSESEEDFEESAGTDSSDEYDLKRGKRRKDSGPIRRSTRARISRYDRDFINDDSDSEETPRRKKTRSIWEESESEESDRSWGRRKRRNAKSKRKTSDKPKKSKKKKKRGTGEDSDPDVYRKRPNIKFGGLNDEEEIGRRTRGKKINYLESLGTDSEDELRRKPPRIEESEDEYVVQEDEDFKHSLENDKDSDESGVENVLKDLPIPTNVKPKSRGRGKAGLKIPRKPKDPGIDLFAPIPPDMPPPIMPMENQLMQTPLLTQPLLLEPQPALREQDLQDIEDEPNPIEQINKNVEQMNEQEMEKMMEEEDYANKQLQLVALQIEKEKKRKEREAQRLEKLVQQTEQKIPKKRGRKPKNQILNISSDIVPAFSESALMLNTNMTNNPELSEPPGISLPLFSEIAPILNAEGMLKKRRGRGKGKKTLAAEAAAMAAAAAANKDSIDMEMGLEGPASSSSNTVSPAPDSPLHGSKLGIAAPPQPFSQSQPTPSVITRMLQSQPGQANFMAGASKYFGGSNGDPQLVGNAPYHPGPAGPRGPLGGPYQQPPPGMTHYPVIRSGPPLPPHRLHSPGPPGLPPMYHSHRPMDPSPSGGGAINVSSSSRDRQSPAVVSPSSNSPLSKGDPTPPPPPYTRPPVGHFPPVAGGGAAPRQMSMVPPHLQPRNMSPYHPGVPPNYHYGTYPPPPPLTSDDGQPPPGYPGTGPTYPEPYPEGGAQMQPPSENGNKPFDEEGGEFVGLVSYFSSQREDDLDT